MRKQNKLRSKKTKPYHLIFRIIAILVILFSSIPFLLPNNENNEFHFKTKIIDCEVKSSCYDDSIWYGYDVFKNPKLWDNLYYDKDVGTGLNIGIIVNHTSSMIEIDKNIENKLLITVAPDGYLRRVK